MIKLAKRISDEIVLEIIEDLKHTKLTHPEISKKYSVSVSFIETVNGCRRGTELHNFKKNIRREYQNIPLEVENTWLLKDSHAELLVTNLKKESGTVLVDLEDYPFLASLKWTIRKTPQNDFRVSCISSGYSNRELHQILLPVEDGLLCDHINRNPLDNRRDNLRMVNRSINATNARARTESKSGVRGVYYRPARPGIAKAAWICEWSINGKRKTKSFSVGIYGDDGAFERACQLREEKINEMKI